MNPLVLGHDPNAARLDATDIVYFRRQLEFVDTAIYSEQLPENRARALIPTYPNVPDWARSLNWRMFKMVGKAKIVANNADDIPRADAQGEEDVRIIKPVASSFAYDIFEIKAARATGMPLDQLRGIAARFAVETEIDEILARGNTLHKLTGLLNQPNVATYTLADKGAGGKTWAVATPAEIVADIFGMVSQVIANMKGAGGPLFQRFVIVMPIAQYALISQMRMGDGSDTTILRFVLQNSPWIEAIEPWHLCQGAGAGDTDRIAVYPRNPLVVAGIVPMEFTTQPPDLRNLEYVINGLATCGGTVVRYPVAMIYADGS